MTVPVTDELMRLSAPALMVWLALLHTQLQMAIIKSQMTDPMQDNSKTRQNVSPEAFARFLEFLSPDTEEAGRRYTRLHEKLVGFFSLRGISDSLSAADE